MSSDRSTVVDLMTTFASHNSLFGFSQPSLYEVVLRHGESMSVKPLTFAEARYIVKTARRLGGVSFFKMKECYFNAQKMRVEDYFLGEDRLEYCEGYVAWEGAPLPLDHAWLRLNGKVIDLTLRAVNKRTPHSYFGLRISSALLMKNQLQTGRYGPVIEGPLQPLVFDPTAETPKSARRRERPKR